MNIDFFDNPADAPRMREDVRLVRMRAEVSPEGRRVAVDMEITPFIERPTIEIYIENERQEKAGLLTIIETLDNIVRVVVHLRDSDPTPQYRIRIALYYASVDADMKRQLVDMWNETFLSEPGFVLEVPPHTGSSEHAQSD